MAASGINEHHEACRKQNFINRQTFKKKVLEQQVGERYDVNDLAAQEVARKLGNTPGHLGPLSSYDLEKLHRQHGTQATDMERRRAIQKSQYLTYSAKINGRLTSTDYTQQW